MKPINWYRAFINWHWLVTNWNGLVTNSYWVLKD